MGAKYYYLYPGSPGYSLHAVDGYDSQSVGRFPREEAREEAREEGTRTSFYLLSLGGHFFH